MRYNRAMLQGLLKLRLSRSRLAAMLVALLLFGQPNGARAENIVSALFGGLFGGGGNPHIIERYPPPQRYPRDAAPMRRIVPHSNSRGPSYWRPRRASLKRIASPAPRPRRAKIKNLRSKPIFSSRSWATRSAILADGLEEAFEETPEIGVNHKFKESSGLVRDDYYDWLKTAQEIANDKHKPDVAVVMLGSNDHQPIEQGAGATNRCRRDWRGIYTARVEA